MKIGSAMGEKVDRCLIVLGFLILASLVAGDDLECSRGEIRALENFKQQVASPTPFFDLWNSSLSCCTWPGINCSSTSESEYVVQGIALRGLKLKGNLQNSSLENLLALKRLDLSGNHLSGQIPGGFSRLQWIDLSSNNFSGSLPQDSFPAAIHLNFSENRLTGSWSLGGQSLQTLDLSTNAISGEIPGQLCSKNSQLRELAVSCNNLSGEIPIGITGCKLLQILDLEENRIQGSIPSFLNQLQLLRVLKLSFNRLQGGIPQELQFLSSLEELWLNQNTIQGRFDSSFIPGSLKIFSARDNRLSGAISINCSAHPQLNYLDLSYNFLTGPIPTSISSCTRIQTLALTGNAFSGEIPGELGDLASLTTLMLSKNNLVGRIPLEALQRSSGLVAMVLSKNSFSSSLDPMAGMLITGFRNLQLLAVGNSNISGSIPAWIRNCSKLQVLDISWNSVTGRVPEWIGEFEHLFYLDLSNNSLAGELPATLVNLKTLRGEQNSAGLKPVESILFVKHRNNMTRLQYNQVSALPPSIILGNNRFTGSIPADIGALRKLVSLDLSNNQLAGEMPVSLSNISSLESLDLSMNMISGVIPASMNKLFYLSKLNLSFNRLEGPIPAGSQFGTFTVASYFGMPRLCGFPFDDCKGNASGLNPSARNSSTSEGEGFTPGNLDLDQRKTRVRNLIIGISLSLGLGITGLVIAAFVWLLSTRRAVHHQDDEDGLEPDDASAMMKRAVDIFQNRELLKLLVKQQRPLTNADLIKATNNFDKSNIVGCGGFGLVFEACLADGTKVAIKRLTGDCLQMEREFEAEVQALAMADHPNLVTLQGYSTYGNERLLIYSYMENGSLDFWLHESPERLDWSTRLDIARGAARGLAYLHLDCQPHIVHRDIKSSNILLDGGFLAHVADFGLARLMLPTATHVSTEVVGTLGYIPPEYAHSWMATPKGDVYSFGVVLLELLATRRPVDVCRTNGVYDLVAWVRELQSCQRGREIFDPLLTGHEVEMEQVLDVACLCINPNPQKRPGIEEVVRWLDDVGCGSSKV